MNVPSEKTNIDHVRRAILGLPYSDMRDMAECLVDMLDGVNLKGPTGLHEMAEVLWTFAERFGEEEQKP